jgi:hypothetical protein
MGQTSEALLLRPLSVGEIFDRGVTLYVATLSRALQILGLYFAGMAAFGGVVLGLVFATHANVFVGAAALVVGIPAFLAGSIWIYSAIIYVWTEQAAGRRVSWREALTAVRPRFWPLLGLSALLVLAVALLFFGVVLVTGIVWAISGLAGSGTGRLIVVLVFAIPGGIGLLVVWVLAYLVLSMAVVTCIVEGAGPTRALGTAYARVVERGMLRRSIGVGFAFFAAVVGVAAVAIGVRLAVTAIFVPIAGAAAGMGIGAAAEAVVEIFGGLYYRGLIVVYYFDVRIRTEGYDLVRAVEQLAT